MTYFDERTRFRQENEPSSSMEKNRVIAQIRTSFDSLSPKLKLAAQFVIDRPTEVALLSMREQAHLAGVQPVTMMRLAKALGFSGFDDLKLIFADDLRRSGESFSTRSISLVAKRQERGDTTLISDYVETLTSHLNLLKDENVMSSLIGAVEILEEATSIYSFGMRSVFPVAYQFSYITSYFSDKTVLLDGPGGIGGDRMQFAPDDAAFLVISLKPYAAQAVSLARIAKKRGLKVIAITDSLMSPIARLADVCIVVETISPSFFDTIAPAFAVSEILAALLAARMGNDVTIRIRDREQQLREAGAFWRERVTRKV